MGTNRVAVLLGHSNLCPKVSPKSDTFGDGMSSRIQTGSELQDQKTERLRWTFLP